MTSTAERADAGTRLRDVLAEVDETPAAYLKAARQLELGRNGDLGLREVHLSFVATFTIDVILPYLIVEGARRSLAIRGSVAPFGQLEQQLLDGDSPTYRSQPECIAIAARVEDTAPALVHDFVRLSPEEIEREVVQFVARLENLLRAVRRHSHAHVLLWNQTLPMHAAAGLADAALDPSQADTIAEINRRLARVCRGTPGAFVFDACRLANEVGLARWEDPKLLHLARIPWSAVAQAATAKRLARYLKALTAVPCKCLVLDLDNTLWGGVLGEEGPDAILLGGDYPGSAFKAFHRFVKTYRDRGVLLGIASKNDEKEVIELFDRHPDCVLRWGDFAARQIHWKDKATSLEAIAEELGISTEALAFFDDSAVEREWVRTRVPEAQVIDVPADPTRYAAALEESGAFDHLVLSEEDRKRAELYRTDVQRRQLAGSAGSVEEFLRALQMRITIGPVDPGTLLRVTQLIAKTNQFNLTARRHTQADVERMIAQGAIALWMRIEDRFGDSGLVGVAIALDGPDGASLDTFLMSCRVLGRRAESALLRAVADRAIDRGASRILAEYVPTKKNGVAAEFLAESGFTTVPERDGWWELDLSAGAPPVPQLFEVLERS
jgi:FkbH-like protein